MRLKRFRFSDLRFHLEFFWVTGTPFTQVETCSKFWGLPRKRDWYVRGLLWNVVGNFGSRHHFKSDFLRVWSFHRRSAFVRLQHAESRRRLLASEEYGKEFSQRPHTQMRMWKSCKQFWKSLDYTVSTCTTQSEHVLHMYYTVWTFTTTNSTPTTQSPHVQHSLNIYYTVSTLTTQCPHVLHSLHTTQSPHVRHSLDVAQ